MNEDGRTSLFSELLTTGLLLLVAGTVTTAMTFVILRMT